MINLTIISDIRLYREALSEILDTDEQICVVGAAYDINSANEVIKTHTPDAILIDMSMDDSCQIVTKILPSYPFIKIIAFMLSGDEDLILTCAKAGITGYVTREASLEQLIQTIYNVIKGELYCPRKIAAGLFNKLKNVHESPIQDDVKIEERVSEKKTTILTQREKQITRLISEGLTNKQIARQLMIEVSTVKNHVHNILSKLDVNSRTQLINLILQEISYQ